MLVRREQVCVRVCVSVSGEDDPLFHCGFFFFHFFFFFKFVTCAPELEPVCPSTH